MSKIDELVKELCLNGVEYKTIEEIADTSIGLATSVTSNKTSEGVQLLHNSDIKPNEIQVKSIEYVSKEFAQKNKNKIHRLHDIISVHTGDVGTSAVIEERFVGTIGFTTLITRIKDFNKVNPYYLSHYLNSNIIKQQIQKVSISDRNNLNQKSFNKLIVAVPPLEVQCEIVHILDNFTLFSAELSAELKARQKQYEYYRNELTKSSDAKKIKFGDIAKIQRGASPRPISEFITNNENGVNWIKIGDVEANQKYITKCKEKITIDGSKKSRNVKKGDFILSNSMSFGRPYILAIDGCIHDGWLSISEFQEYYIPDFLYHLLSSNEIQNEFRKKASFGGAVQNLNVDIVRNIELPLISLEKQKEIVKVLDKFESFTNDMTIGLPAEIEARQMQYEYYRDKLLTFEEKKDE